MTTDYEYLLSSLASNRRALAHAKGLIQEQTDAVLLAMQETPEYKEANMVKITCEADIAELEVEIKKAALIECAETGNKKPHPKLQIKTFKTFKILDSALVRDWTLKNIPDAMVPDLDKIKKYALDIAPVDGTVVGSENRCQIATDLG